MLQETRTKQCCILLMLWNSYNVLYTIYCKSLMACLTLRWFYLDLLCCHPAWWGSSRGFMVFNQSPSTCSSTCLSAQSPCMVLSIPRARLWLTEPGALGPTQGHQHCSAPLSPWAHQGPAQPSSGISPPCCFVGGTRAHLPFCQLLLSFTLIL